MDETMLDPEVATILRDSFIGSIDLESLELEGVPMLRQGLLAFFPPQESPGVVHRDVVAAVAGRPEVGARLYSPAAAGAGRSCLLWMHAGGYLTGAPVVDDARINRWVEQFDCVAVSVDYRLAPEHPYPAAIEDCYTALAWTAGHAEELGIDPSRIVVAGASAGGGLAAALALMARDRGEVAVSYQLLIYPMMDDRTESYPSGRLAAPIWPVKANSMGWRAYLGSEPGHPDVPPYAVAARAADLAGLPPAFIGVGAVDINRDEAVYYALRLLEAGVPTDLHVYRGSPHGFEFLAPGAAVSQRFQRDMDDALRPVLQSAGSYVSV